MIVTEGEIRIKFLDNNQLEFIDYLGKSIDPFMVLDDIVSSKRELRWDSRTCSHNNVDGKFYSTSVGYIIK